MQILLPQSTGLIKSYKLSSSSSREFPQWLVRLRTRFWTILVFRLSKSYLSHITLKLLANSIQLNTKIQWTQYFSRSFFVSTDCLRLSDHISSISERPSKVRKPCLPSWRRSEILSLITGSPLTGGSAHTLHWSHSQDTFFISLRDYCLLEVER